MARPDPSLARILPRRPRRGAKPPRTTLQSLPRCNPLQSHPQRGVRLHSLVALHRFSRHLPEEISPETLRTG